MGRHQPYVRSGLMGVSVQGHSPRHVRVLEVTLEWVQTVWMRTESESLQPLEGVAREAEITTLLTADEQCIFLSVLVTGNF